MRINTKCKKCNKEMKQVYHTKRYCAECVLILNKQNQRKAELKRVGTRNEYHKQKWQRTREKVLEDYHKTHHKELICPNCSALFMQNNTAQKYCSPECLKQKHYLDNKERYNKRGKLRYEEFARVNNIKSLIRKDIERQKDKIIDLYCNKKLSQSSIAQLMKCDFCVISRILKENKIERRTINKSKTNEEFYGKEKADEMRAKIKLARAKQIFPMKDTKVEVKIQNFLRELGIEFFTHQYISEITHAYQCDILINPQQNFMAQKKTIIEVDGDYWHGNPAKFPNPNQMQKEQMEEDACRNEELRFAGFEVIRLWENEIKKMSLEDFKNILDKKLHKHNINCVQGKIKWKTKCLLK